MKGDSVSGIVPASDDRIGLFTCARVRERRADEKEN